MDIKQIKELMSAMERAGIKKVSIKEKSGFELLLERQEEHSLEHHELSHSRFVPNASHPIPSSTMQRGLHHHEESPQPKQERVEGKFVTSPMVGTFYSSPSPDDPAFVKVGDTVEEGTVLCIIEAMKVMNEVKAGMRGTVAEVCLDSGHPVEFGTKLFRIV